jgi:hypothetical protein
MMKLLNYQLQTHIESLSGAKSTQFFSDYVRTILQDTTKPYYQRADYVGLSLQEIKAKIDTLTSDIKELQTLKKRLSESLDMAKEIIATVFLENGVDRIDGNIISSLTLSNETSSTQTSFTILDHEAVMRLGYIKYQPDIEAIEQAMMRDEGKKELAQFVKSETNTTITPAKVKVNAKRIALGSQAEELLNIVEAA